MSLINDKPESSKVQNNAAGRFFNNSVFFNINFDNFFCYNSAVNPQTPSNA